MYLRCKWMQLVYLQIIIVKYHQLESSTEKVYYILIVCVLVFMHLSFTKTSITGKACSPSPFSRVFFPGLFA